MDTTTIHPEEILKRVWDDKFSHTPWKFAFDVDASLPSCIVKARF